MGNACYGVKEDEDNPNRYESFSANLLHQKRSDEIFKFYEVTRVLGEGSMGAVSMIRKKTVVGAAAYKDSPPRSMPKKKAREFHGQNEFALKTIQLGRVTDEFLEELRNEIDILRRLDHPNIVKAYEVYETKRQIYVVMELCSGGDLYSRRPYSEKGAAQIVGKLLSAIAFMHDNNVVHRDLKFENIMFESRHPEAEIKVIDFGLSKKYLPGNEMMTEGVGTIYTMAPQVMQGVYTSKADIWSVGVIAYMLLSSRKPFSDRNRRRLIDKILRCRYDFYAPIWEEISNDAKHFVGSLIKIDPKQRLSAKAALKHNWLRKQYKLSDRRPDESLMENVGDTLMDYDTTTKFKKISLLVLAHKSSTQEIMELRKVFDQYDTSNDGKITYEEFKAALEKSNYSDKEIDQLFASMDQFKNGVIEYTEFLAATLEVNGHIQEDRLAEAFDRIDSDNSGFISKKNLLDLLGTEVKSEKEVAKIIDEVDLNKDGKISYQEFIQAFRAEKKKNKKLLLDQPVSASVASSEELMGLDSFIPGGKFDTPRNQRG